ncbi:hypothetical protein PPUJ13061_31970 [Pseudomonas putida]|uniref:DUF3383 family protein n=1 Tax=Pseudomonas putida TaxID=303 RepID=UPI000E0DAB32|nr:DUF3383 family protein [Pseudomonas putida]WQE51593.1 DUF3383 family protein [Pseudomonas putida]GLO03299.1 hypothetical protein PPUJ13061_31970 [Pseudomonas putida]HDS1005793.1 DUF3383 family protein [Pseudomonas putida]
MPYPAENIINIVTNIRAAGLGTANFGAGMVFADFDSSTDATFAEGSYRDYGGAAAVAADFNIASDPYLAALAWFSSIPKPLSLRIYLRQEDDSPVESMNDAINKRIWFYWYEFETTIRANDADVLALIVAGDAAGKFYAGTTNQAAVRDPSLATDIVSKAKLQGSRRAFLLSHATAPYAGFELGAVFSRVNFNAANSTITGEFKKLPDITAEDLTITAYSAMKEKGAPFYTVVETGGQVDNGRVINSKSTSSFGEFIDDVFNLDGFVNTLTVNVYNALANAKKLGQTPDGQQVLIDAASQVGQRYIDNGYLGPRTYTDGETGEEKLSDGWLMLSKADDILSILDSERSGRFSAPIRMRVFRAGAIHAVDITVDVE